MDNTTFMMVPSEVIRDLAELARDLRKVISNFKSDAPLTIGDWVPEPEAKRMLGRKTTWFYLRRKSGELAGKKRGGQWWYHQNELLQFIEGKNMDG